jgi:hypothetical protein
MKLPEMELAKMKTVGTIDLNDEEGGINPLVRFKQSACLCVEEALARCSDLFSAYGHSVCAGGAVRDIISDSYPIKDIDIFIIGKSCNGKKELLSNREKLSALIEGENQKNPHLAPQNENKADDLDYGEANALMRSKDKRIDKKWPVGTLTNGTLPQIQVMYRPDVLGASDLIDSFDLKWARYAVSVWKRNGKITYRLTTGSEIDDILFFPMDNVCDLLKNTSNPLIKRNSDNFSLINKNCDFLNPRVTIKRLATQCQKLNKKINHKDLDFLIEKAFEQIQKEKEANNLIDDFPF